MINLGLCPFTVGTESRMFGDHYAARANVKDFGATGDGETDDWAAITDAIQSVFPGNGHLHFPAGHYMISQALAFHEILGGLVSGDGAGCTRITFNGELIVNARTVFGFAPGTNVVDSVFDLDGCQMTIFRDLTLEMPYSGHAFAGAGGAVNSTMCMNLDRWVSPGSNNIHGLTMLDMVFIGADWGIGAGVGFLYLTSVLASEMAYIHCKFIECKWNAVRIFTQNGLNHHAWFCHFIRCGSTPTVVGDNTFSTFSAHPGAVVAIMFCIFEDSKDIDVTPGSNTTLMMGVIHRSTVAKNIDDGPSLFAAGGGVRGMGLVFENTTADDTVIFKKTNAILDVCDFKTGVVGPGEDYMISHLKSCTFGHATPFATAGRYTLFVDDVFLQGPGLLTPLVTGAPVVFAPTLTATA